MDHLVIAELEASQGRILARSLWERVAVAERGAGRRPDISEFYGVLHRLERRKIVRTTLGNRPAPIGEDDGLTVYVEFGDAGASASVCADGAHPSTSRGGAGSSERAIGTRTRAVLGLVRSSDQSYSGRPSERGEANLTLVLIALVIGTISAAIVAPNFMTNADSYRPAKVAVDDAIHAARDIARGQSNAVPSGSSMFVYPKGTGFEIDIMAGRPAAGETLGGVVQRFVAPNATLTLAGGTATFGEFVGASGTLTQPEAWDGQSSAAIPPTCDPTTHAIAVVLTAPRVPAQTLTYGCNPQ